MMSDLAAYAGMFVTALLAATLLPLQSEATLVALVAAGEQPAGVLVAIASIGNVLGSSINWLLGGAIERFRERPWFPVAPVALERAQGWYRRFGKWSLLLSWAPVIGDPLTIMAGLAREPFWIFLLLVAAAKTGRYLVLAALTLNLF